MFRVAVVYLDIALALIPQYFTRWSKHDLTTSAHQRRPSRDGLKTPMSPASSAGSGSGYSTPSTHSPYNSENKYLTSGHRSPHRRKSSYGFGAALRHSRRSSQASLTSIGTITPIHEDDGPLSVPESGMIPSVGVGRDFEGIGGWRLDEGDDGDESQWSKINSRLELPLERSSARHHQRSQSVGPTTPSEAVWMMTKSTRKDSSPEWKGWERTGSISPARPLFSPGDSRRPNQSIQLPSALTALNPENGYFPDLVSPRSWKKYTP
ncbi:hypothetical protein B0H67DRAFT_578568 [Lasiosphaeris hirsuta]|uniref:Uncharacterized protein n=1 Tax=Lasiosphaeris hirsuta TaxID=260670 RepID=A0AA40AEY0_9PEZI|nr:hypothetical protein B0H67DRAFT_578568 [Lasiosphaeris hirsuta]